MRYFSFMQAKLPNNLPIFPLSKVILLPETLLPLHIFEPRYLAMVDEALRYDRLIGMIQPKRAETDDNPAILYDMGCAGRIISFHEIEGGRYMITLNGQARFRIKKEMSDGQAYRSVQPLWIEEPKASEAVTQKISAQWEELLPELETFFTIKDMACNWESVVAAPREKLLSLLCMICPFETAEKQALLESKDTQKRFEIFTQLIRLSLQEGCAAPSYMH